MPYDMQYSWQANAALYSLSPSEREQVNAALQRLRAGEFRSMPEVRRLDGNGTPEELYVLRVGDAFRVVFRIEPDDVISVRDIINRQLMQNYG
jgi:mRNA-degrading endonuclease RelE of RelBE toxin-antitoxin system